MEERKSEWESARGSLLRKRWTHTLIQLIESHKLLRVFVALLRYMGCVTPHRYIWLNLYASRFAYYKYIRNLINRYVVGEEQKVQFKTFDYLNNKHTCILWLILKMANTKSKTLVFKFCKEIIYSQACGCWFELRGSTLYTPVKRSTK